MKFTKTAENNRRQWTKRNSDYLAMKKYIKNIKANPVTFIWMHPALNIV